MKREGVGLVCALVLGAAIGAGQYLSASSDVPIEDVTEASPSPAVTLVSNDPVLTNPETITTDGVNLYIGIGGSIVSVPNSGGPATMLYAEAAPYRVNGLTRLGTDLFWIDPNGDHEATAILRGSTTGDPVTMVYSGSAAEQVIVDGADITSAGSKLYTIDYVQGQIHSVSADGSAVTFLGASFGGFFDSAHLSTMTERDGLLYVADSGLLPDVSAPHVFSVPATGGAAVTLHTGEPFAGLTDIAVGDGVVYVADQPANTIWQLPAGGGPPAALVAGAPFVQVAGVVYWENALYVTDTGNAGTVDGPGAIYRIDVPSANEAPVADDQSARTGRNTARAITLSATDADADPLAYSIVAAPAHGTLTGTAPNVIYTPAIGYSGPDSVTFTANDGTVNSHTATVSIIVTMSTTTTVGSSKNPSVFGQPVTLTATIDNGSQTPGTGSVEFFDGTSSLGMAPVGSGTVSLTSTTVNAGSRPITAVYSGDQNNEASASPATTQTVNKSATTTTLTLTPLTRQYSDRETFEATVTPQNGNGQAPAESVTFKIGTQTMGTAPLVASGGTYKARLSDVPLLESSSPTGQLMPGTRIVIAVFNNVNSNFTVSNPLKTLGIYREDARATYTGPKAVKTSSPDRRKATVKLSATVKEISATSEASGDTDAGDIRRAMLAFVNRGTGATIAFVPVALVKEDDTTTGTASYDWTVDIGTANAKTFKVGLIVINYHTRNSSLDDVLITVYK